MKKLKEYNPELGLCLFMLIPLSLMAFIAWCLVYYPPGFFVAMFVLFALCLSGGPEGA